MGFRPGLKARLPINCGELFLNSGSEATETFLLRFATGLLLPRDLERLPQVKLFHEAAGARRVVRISGDDLSPRLSSERRLAQRQALAKNLARVTGQAQIVQMIRK